MIFQDLCTIFGKFDMIFVDSSQTNARKKKNFVDFVRRQQISQFFVKF